MEFTRTIPLHTGREMPVMGLGTWELLDDTAGTIEYALGLGYPMIDTACDYHTQPGIGEGIRRSGVPRERFYLVSKTEETEDAFEGCKRNLRELGLDYVDLTVIHRPPESGAGIDLWHGLIRAREQGLTRDIGVSNYSIEEIEELRAATGELPVVNQIEWSPFGWSAEMLAWCREHDVVVQAYSPLTRAERLDDNRLRGIAARYDRSPAQLLIRWNIQMDVVPIPKANRRDHLKENLEVLDFVIEDADMQRLGALNQEWSALGSRPQYVHA